MSSFKAPPKVVTSTFAPTVSNIQIINHQVIFTGTNLDSVTNFKIQDGSTTYKMQIESQTSSSLIANAVDNFNLVANNLFNFILSSADAQALYTINFSLCDSTVAGVGFNCAVTPTDKDILSYDASTNTWAPRTFSGLKYLGAWDATAGTAPPVTNIGDYFIISKLGTISAVSYVVGDWIVLNTSHVWEKVSNSSALVTVFGRTGAVVAVKGDYSLSLMSDIDFSSAPQTNQVLTYNGTNWSPGNLTLTSSVCDPAVVAGAVSLDFTNCDDIKVLTAANTTITLPTPIAGKTTSVKVCYGGVHSITWAGGGTLSWAGGTAPVATSTNGRCDYYTFHSHDTTYTDGKDGGRNFVGH